LARTLIHKGKQLIPGNLGFTKENVDADVSNAFEFLKQLAFSGRHFGPRLLASCANHLDNDPGSIAPYIPTYGMFSRHNGAYPDLFSVRVRSSQLAATIFSGVTQP
jgi:hypothetical protein